MNNTIIDATPVRPTRKRNLSSTEKTVSTLKRHNTDADTDALNIPLEEEIVSPTISVSQMENSRDNNEDRLEMILNKLQKLDVIAEKCKVLIV